MDINKARKIMGESGKRLSDKELLVVIRSLEDLAVTCIEEVTNSSETVKQNIAASGVKNFGSSDREW
jgi:hypothetical protein